MRKKLNKRTVFGSLPWLIPVVLTVVFLLPFSGILAAAIIGLNALVAAACMKLFFPMLFDDVFANQKAIKNPSHTPGYNEFQIGRYRLGWEIFFGIWVMLNLLKALM